jgi:type II secretory pathway component PulF
LPLFYYTAVTQAGERKSGALEAPDTSELAKALRQEGFILTSAKPAQTPKSFSSSLGKILGAFNIFGGVPLVEKMLFARHLSVMVKAGFSLNKALQVLILQTKKKRFVKVLTELEEDVRKGTAFGDALAKYPDVFSDLFVNMVKVGEASGNLEGDLKLLAIQMKKDHDLRSKVKSAMMYPAVILVAMLAIGGAMMIFVVPKLMSVFEDLNAELPLATRIVINVSKFLSTQWWLALLVLVALIVGVRAVLRTKEGLRMLDKLILHAPIFGNISKKINSARLARTLSSLIESGVSIVRALEISAGTLTNGLFSESLMNASREVQKGQPLSQSLAAYPNLYLPIVTQMIQVGEETGTLGDITKRLAEFYEEEVTNVTKGLSTIIEPILMVIIGAAVGFFAISMIQPMYSMMNSI